MSGFDITENKFLSYLEKEGMRPLLAKGVLLALSGGKDSSLLLRFISRLAAKDGFPLVAFHLNHEIRGDEAERDAAFCADMCERLSVPLVSLRADVPTLAKQSGEGIEETARRERYRLLRDVAKENGLGTVLTAHNATDNLETVLLHLTRGGGGNAMCGIPPVRPLDGGDDSVLLLRPLLSLTAEEILLAVKEADIPYVSDSTNDDRAYRRNLIRGEVLPHLRKCNPSVERSVLRLTENMREDMRLLDSLAMRAFDEARVAGGISVSRLREIEKPLAYRVLRRLHEAAAQDVPLPERVHVDALLVRLTEAGDFSLSFPGNIHAVREGDVLYFRVGAPFSHSRQSLHKGENILSDGGRLYVMEKDSPPADENIYTLSIQLPRAFATIEYGLYVRSRADGDVYRTGGMTRKLKKLFSDASIPPRLRAHLPVVCDTEGILWVPPFGVRDGTSSEARLLYAPPEALREELAPYLKKRKPRPQKRTTK